MAHLQSKYHMVWPTVVSAVRLFRRALLTGEAGLRQSFLRAMSTAHRVDNIDFEVVDPGCDWALVLEKLKAAQADLAQTAAAAAAELVLDGMNTEGSKEAPPSAVDAQQDVPAAAQDSGNASGTAPRQLQTGTGEGTPAGDTQEDAKPKNIAQEDKDLKGMIQTASMLADEMLTLYERPWQRGTLNPLP